MPGNSTTKSARERAGSNQTLFVLPGARTTRPPAISTRLTEPPPGTARSDPAPLRVAWRPDDPAAGDLHRPHRDPAAAGQRHHVGLPVARQAGADRVALEPGRQLGGPRRRGRRGPP